MSHIILGGGISGLSAAYYLSKTFLNEIKIYESSNRVGGWIKSLKSKNGALFEQGPRTLRSIGEASLNTVELAEELGLSSSIKPILSDNIAAKNRLIYFNKQLIPLPSNFRSLYKIDPPIVKPFIFAILKDLKTRKVEAEDESIHDFVARRFGKDYAENMLGAVTCGIFGGDAKEISIRALKPMENLFEMEQTYGGVLYGMILSTFKSRKKNPYINTRRKIRNWFVWTLEDGLETLPNQILASLKQKHNVDILLETKCSKIVFEKGKVLYTVNGNTETAEHVYSSLPSKELAKIIGDEHSFLKNELMSIPFVSLGVVNLEYEGDLLETKGFGLLVPPNQNLPILGITFDSCIFQEEGKTILTVMMGGRWFEQHFGSNPDEKTLLKIARDHVKLILKINKEPTDSLVTILKEAIPQYVVGHSKRIQRIREYIEKNKLPLTLIGNSFDGVGVGDAILSARIHVENNLKNLKSNVLYNQVL